MIYLSILDRVSTPSTDHVGHAGSGISIPPIFLTLSYYFRYRFFLFSRVARRFAANAMPGLFPPAILGLSRLLEFTATRAERIFDGEHAPRQVKWDGMECHTLSTSFERYFTIQRLLLAGACRFAQRRWTLNNAIPLSFFQRQSVSPDAGFFDASGTRDLASASGESFNLPRQGSDRSGLSQLHKSAAEQRQDSFYVRNECFQSSVHMERGI